MDEMLSPLLIYYHVIRYVQIANGISTKSYNVLPQDIKSYDYTTSFLRVVPRKKHRHISK